MQYRKLGRSGLDVSVIGLGCNNFGLLELERAKAVAYKALDLGITLFDTSDVYGGHPGGSEEHLGEILGPRRKDIVLATKFGIAIDNEGRKNGASRRYIVTTIEASLKRLKTDWIDLYQLHTPDPTTPLEETLSALDDLVRTGKVRYLGCSNLPAWQIAHASWIALDSKQNRFVSAQDEYNLLARKAEAELIPALERFGMGLIPYFPLASGLLTGKYKRGEQLFSTTRLAIIAQMTDHFASERNFAMVETLDAFCRERGRTLLELAFSWLSRRAPVASVIAGATRPEQVEQNAKAAGWTLSSDEFAEVDRLTAGSAS